MFSSQSKKSVGLYWFTNDLRLEDNLALTRAATQVDQLICVYIIDPSWFQPNNFGMKPLGNHRWEFLQQSLVCLEEALRNLGQCLYITRAKPVKEISQIITNFDVDNVFRSENAGYYENSQWQKIKEKHTDVSFTEYPTHTLLSRQALPFPVDELPQTFSKFRFLVEPIYLEKEIIEKTLPKISKLPPCPQGLRSSNRLRVIETDIGGFRGGTRQAKRHIMDYFSQTFPANYKKTRNELDGWNNSTKFSPWLANGSLSVRRLASVVLNYEESVIKNDSTYWILFELLWREYFQWMAHKFRNKMFTPTGIKNKKQLNSFYPERFQRWCNGNTPYPLVNACMKQLNAVGYMSNRGRQIVASCLINELNVDWRYGAAYFEQQLIDYDVAVNWDNWQYLAGVGADPRGKRHFDIVKQTAIYDPQGMFIKKWRGDEYDGFMDAIDAADWPVMID